MKVRGVTLANDGAHLFASCLSLNPSLQYLDLSSNAIDEVGILEIADSLRLNYNLKKIWLNDRKIGLFDLHLIFIVQNRR